MPILKCILAGALSLAGFALIAPVCVLIILGAFTRHEQGTSVGIDRVSIMRSFPALWLVPALVFLLGVAWEYRRLRAR